MWCRRSGKCWTRSKTSQTRYAPGIAPVMCLKLTLSQNLASMHACSAMQAMLCRSAMQLPFTALTPPQTCSRALTARCQVHEALQLCKYIWPTLYALPIDIISSTPLSSLHHPHAVLVMCRCVLVSGRVPQERSSQMWWPSALVAPSWVPCLLILRSGPCAVWADSMAQDQLQVCCIL